MSALKVLPSQQDRRDPSRGGHGPGALPMANPPWPWFAFAQPRMRKDTGAFTRCDIVAAHWSRGAKHSASTEIRRGSGSVASSPSSKFGRLGGAGLSICWKCVACPALSRAAQIRQGERALGAENSGVSILDDLRPIRAQYLPTGYV